MSYTIHKYTLDPSSVGKVEAIEMHDDARVISFQNQLDPYDRQEVPVIWVLESPDRPKVLFPFKLAMTGEQVPGGEERAVERYLGTAQFDGGRFVLHLFSMELQNDV